MNAWKIKSEAVLNRAGCSSARMVNLSTDKYKHETQTLYLVDLLLDSYLAIYAVRSQDYLISCISACSAILVHVW